MNSLHFGHFMSPIRAVNPAATAELSAALAVFLRIEPITQKKVSVTARAPKMKNAVVPSMSRWYRPKPARYKNLTTVKLNHTNSFHEVHLSVCS